MATGSKKTLSDLVWKNLPTGYRIPKRVAVDEVSSKKKVRDTQDAEMEKTKKKKKKKRKISESSDSS